MLPPPAAVASFSQLATEIMISSGVRSPSSPLFQSLVGVLDALANRANLAVPVLDLLAVAIASINLDQVSDALHAFHRHVIASQSTPRVLICFVTRHSSLVTRACAVTAPTRPPAAPLLLHPIPPPRPRPRSRSRTAPPR